VTEKKENTQNTSARRVGKVYLVGAGPGDPGLITLRGKYLLERAEVVIYDYLANKKLLQYVKPTAEFIYAGKKGGIKHTHTQEEINRMLIERALAGYTVVRLKGGDPFIFGRGGEELQELVKAGVPFEVVPGVTSATAAATYAGIPITHREYTSTVAFITGHEDPSKKDSKVAWDKLATGAGTIVVYMGIKNLPVITEKLIRYGRDPKTPVAVVRWASTPEQRSVVGTLETIAEIVKEAEILPPSLVVIGEVVNLRETIDWFEHRPLFGKKILVTRTREHASDLVTRLEEQGAACLEFATINIAPVENYDTLDRELQDIENCDWMIFTSINAVHYFFARLYELNMDVRDLKGPKIAVVGRTTADMLRNHGIVADLLPEKFTGEGLAEALVNQGVAGAKILIPRAEKAREILPETLRKAGAEVCVAPVYRNVLPEPDSKNDQSQEVIKGLEDKSIELITFTSSSTVRNFAKMAAGDSLERLARLLDGVAIAAIGPITAKTVNDYGLEVDIQPDTYTIPEMVNSIVDHYKE
jgi:uroporphyrinogen III methyltransferase/synthase